MLLVVDNIPEHGEAMFQQALELKLEGIVAKRIMSPYQAGVRSANWLKVKRPGAVPAKRFDRSSTALQCGVLPRQSLRLLLTQDCFS